MRLDRLPPARGRAGRRAGRLHIAVTATRAMLNHAEGSQRECFARSCSNRLRVADSMRPPCTRAGHAFSTWLILHPHSGSIVALNGEEGSQWDKFREGRHGRNTAF